MLETILYVYLAGWIGTSSYSAYKCEPTRVSSKGECVAIAVASGAVWPIGIYYLVKD